MQGKHVFCVIPGVFGITGKLGNIWRGNFHRTWTVKLTLQAVAQVQSMSFTVQIR